MARKNICETRIIGDSSVEQFLPINDPVCDEMKAAQVSLGGVSSLLHPYRIIRKAPRFHAIVYTLSGEARLHWPIDGERTADRAHFVEPGTRLVLPGNVCHHYYVEPKRDWSIIWFHLRPVARWDYILRRGVQLHSVDFGYRLNTIAAEFFTEYYANPDAKRGAAKPLASALTRLFLNDIKPVQQNEKEESYARHRLYELERAIRIGFQKPWTITEMARVVHLSESQLHRLAKEAWDCTPMDFLTEIRMQHAAMLLRSTYDKVEQIAAAVGYENPFAFSVRFSRFSGLSPRAYRAVELE